MLDPLKSYQRSAGYFHDLDRVVPEEIPEPDFILGKAPETKTDKSPEQTPERISDIFLWAGLQD